MLCLVKHNAYAFPLCSMYGWKYEIGEFKHDLIPFLKVTEGRSHTLGVFSSLRCQWERDDKGQSGSPLIL